MPPFPKRYADTVAKLRVPAGFVLVVVFAWFSRPTIPIARPGPAVRPCGAIPARLGCRLSGKKPATGHRRPVRLHAQPALSRHPAGTAGW